MGIFGTTMLSAGLFMGGLMALLTMLLSWINNRFSIREDPRLAQVESMLPRTNCGACGFPGCHAFAEALLHQQALPGKCTVSSLESKQRIASFLRIDIGDTEQKVARLACGGGDNVARQRVNYVGLPSCQAAAQTSGGTKACTWGCLGFGDCEVACDFSAINMNSNGLPQIDEALCTACGDCVKACPKALLSLEPITHRLWVACNNHEIGDSLLNICEVACTACGRCAMDAPSGLIVMRDNLPRIDYSQAHGTLAPIQRCPSGAIVWLNTDGTLTKGRESKKIIRHSPLPTRGT